MQKKRYIPRLIEQSLLARAREFPVVVLTGPRQSGKSTTLQHIFPHYNYVSMDDPLTQSLALNDPKLFLENNKPPLIIDEIQYATELLPYLKIHVDKNRGKNGAFILTGSQIFNLMEGISETLAGRAVLFELLGFSFEELLKAKLVKKTAEGCFRFIYKGFFPDPCVHSVELNAFYGSYIQTYLERDIRQIKSVHDLRLFQQFLELLAARVGSLLNLNEIAKECAISHTTAKNWLSLLESTRIIYLLRPYFKNITKRVIKSPKIYFTDTGLLAYILKYPDDKTLRSGPIGGAIFENMLIMEVLKNKFNRSKRFELYFFRDSNHNEVDLLLDFGFKIVLIEAKLTKSLQERHWKMLSRFQNTLKAREVYISSLADDDIAVAGNIRAVPWWGISNILK
ncbi:MAG: ATP-binding protein [Candidatus Omnitrophota bacterium]